MDDNFIRAEAGLRCDLAAALHVRGEQDEAKRHLKGRGTRPAHRISPPAPPHPRPVHRIAKAA